MHILNLGSGTGRNAHCLANLSNVVFGLEISPTAIKTANQKNPLSHLSNKASERNIPLRIIFLTLFLISLLPMPLMKKSGQFIYKNLFACLSQVSIFLFVLLNKNSKKLIEKFPGKEKDTYVIPRTNLVERVFPEMIFSLLTMTYLPPFNSQTKAVILLSNNNHTNVIIG